MSEGERRLRALVRAALSPGVWLAIGAQWLFTLLLRVNPFPASEGMYALARIAALSGSLLLFFFTLAGVSRALAVDREVVSVRRVLAVAPAVAARFLWLVVKASLFATLILNIVFILVRAGGEADIRAFIERQAEWFVWGSAALGFVFVYWLPLVFARGDFRLVATLIEALRILRQRLSGAGFLLLLTLAPTAIYAVLPEGATAWAPMLVGALGSFLGWIAFAYCAEWLQDYSAVTKEEAVS
jgi:hypothetical protein